MINRRAEEKITALYERLSRDDEPLTSQGGIRGDSNSIVNQKLMLENYARQNGFMNIRHYTDDGYSGGNFDRPAWKQLISDVENGKIACVIAKDMSRIGREYLQTGFYTEIMFRQHGIRFIAVGNSVDTANQESSEFAPFLNIMNEWYLRDCSRKQIAAYKLRGNAGKHTGAHPPYGYKKDTDDKHHWLVDEEAAKVVKRIFSLSIEGYGVGQIAKILTDDKIERPSYYAATRRMGTSQKSYDTEHPYDWSTGTVSNIISRPEYMGHTVNFRTYKENYKDKKRLMRSQDEWKVFENTHEAIVDKETWKLAQKLRKTPRRAIKETEIANPFTGLLFCSDCGSKMYNHRERMRAQRENKGINPVTGLYPYEHYECSRYSLSYSHSRSNCCSHYINGNAIYDIVLETIKYVAEYAISDKKRFVEKIKEASRIKQLEKIKVLQKKLGHDRKRHAELDGIIKKLYESFWTGKILEKRFELMSEEYEAEQIQLENDIADAKSELKTYETDEDRTSLFLTLSKKYTDFSVLTPSMINEFIDKIIIHSADKSSGDRVQEIEIYLKYIGKFDVPTPEITLEEAEEQEKMRNHRLKRREIDRRYRERQKEKN